MYKKLLERPLFYNAWSAIHFIPRLNAIQEVIKEQTLPSVLDLGCGTGLLKKHFPACNYTGIDTNLNYINYARQKLRGQFILGSILELERIGLRDQFDFIILNGVLHHLENGNAARLINSLNRYLKAQGKIIVIDHFFSDELNPLNRLLLNWDRGSFSRTEAEYRTLFKKFTVWSYSIFDITAGPFVLWKQVRFVLTCC